MLIKNKTQEDEAPKGIWIPIEVWEHPELNVKDKMVYGLISLLGKTTRDEVLEKAREDLKLGRANTTKSYLKLEEFGLVIINRPGLGQKMHLMAVNINE